jgi:hypothetical protein
MASHIEHEMTSCVTEIEHLYAKMMKLQDTKKKQEKQKEEKTNESEPNMAVMKNWLDIDKYNEEQKALSNVAKKNYDDYCFRMRGRHSHINPLSEKEDEERKFMMDDYRKYCLRKHTRYGETIEPPSKRMEAFNTGGSPSQFMIDFVEATHNLFKIQQKRIDELETIVAESNTGVEVKHANV